MCVCMRACVRVSECVCVVYCLCMHTCVYVIADLQRVLNLFRLLLHVRLTKYAESANVFSILVYKVITSLHWVSSSSLESPVSPDSLMSPSLSPSPSPICMDVIRCARNCCFVCVCFL